MRAGIIVVTFMAGVVATLLYGCYIHHSVRRTHHIYAVPRHAEKEVVEIQESPPPTRSARLMSSESHKRMAQSHRARRRGGRRRFGEHRKACTLVFNPNTNDHCGYSCLLKAKGIVPSPSGIQDLRDATARGVKEAYLNDVYVNDMSVRDLVQSTDMTLDAYTAEVKWKLWASPIEMAIAANLSAGACSSVSGWKDHAHWNGP